MDSLYSRYATALLSLAKEEKKVQDYKDALIEILDYLKEHIETARYIESYSVSEEDKYVVIDKIAEPFKLKSLASFIKVISKRRRFHSFKKIVKEYIKVANEELGILEGIAYVTLELNKAELNRVEEVISKDLHQKVELRQIIDKHLIGGIKVIVNDRVYDGSIRGKLSSLKSNLNERSKE